MTEPTDDYLFRSLGKSEFVHATRRAIQNTPEASRWDIHGVDSLSAVCVPVTEAISRVFGSGLRAQLWMPRPPNNVHAGKFEIQNRLEAYSPSRSTAIRKAIAKSVRAHFLSCGLPDGVEKSGGSTVVRCHYRVPLIEGIDDDTAENSALYRGEISKLVGFFAFLDSALSDWLKNGKQSLEEIKLSEKAG